MSHFSYVVEAPVDPIFGLTAAFLQDPRKNKINLGIGVYKTEELQTPVLSCVKQAEKDLLEKETSKNYLPVEGDVLYLELVARLVLGDKLYQTYLDSLRLVQTIGGSGGLRLGGEFLAKGSQRTIYIPNPSWMNHQAIFTQCGFKVESYPYYDMENNSLAFVDMVEYLSQIPAESPILLHVSCHNPSGADLGKEQWEILAELCVEKKLIPFFDAAYLGFDGTVEEDVFPIRLFMEKKIEFLLSISFSKNLSLYAERVGAFFLFSDTLCSKKIFSQCRVLVRRNYSNPPMHGAKIVSKILQSPSLKQLWEEELLQMRQRILTMKNKFVAALSSEGSKKDYSYLLGKKGLFFFSGLTADQVALLKKEYGIYMTADGRINIAGLNQESLFLVARAIVAVGG
ncbi:MAG: aromatic amino acid transaminase [Chlamydiota bacterium]